MAENRLHRPDGSFVYRGLGNRQVHFFRAEKSWLAINFSGKEVNFLEKEFLELFLLAGGFLLAMEMLGVGGIFYRHYRVFQQQKKEGKLIGI